MILSGLFPSTTKPPDLCPPRAAWAWDSGRCRASGSHAALTGALPSPRGSFRKAPGQPTQASPAPMGAHPESLLGASLLHRVLIVGISLKR